MSPAKVTHDHGAAAGPPRAGNPLAEAAAVAVTFHSVSVLASKSLQGWGRKRRGLERPGGWEKEEEQGCRRTEQARVSQGPQLRYVVLMSGEQPPPSHHLLEGHGRRCRDPQGALGLLFWGSTCFYTPAHPPLDVWKNGHWQ